MGLHAALNKALATIDGDDYTAATIRGMLRAYDARWRDAHANIDIRDIEKEWTAGLVNLDSERLSKSRTFRMAGKIDKVATINGRTTIIDHKTTSQDISDPASPYWRQLSVEGQPSHYELLLHANGVQVQDVVWDVARKPTIKPKAVAKKDVAAFASLGVYAGRRFFQPGHCPDWVREGMRETPEMFESRVAETMTDQHERYFARRSFKRTRQELVEYARELWQIGQEIVRARREDGWYRNSGACFRFGSPCAYLGICSGFDSPESDKWERAESVHPELEDAHGAGDLLTNSRSACFKTCRRMHLYRYEMGLRRIDEEEKEPLRFGTAWHTALDHWWREVA